MNAATEYVETVTEHESSEWEDRLLSLSAFIAGAGVVFTIPLVGQLPVSELPLVPLAFWVLWLTIRMRGWPHPLMRTRTFKNLLIAAGVSLIGYIMSDLIRGTPATDIARGWARVAFLAIDIISLGYILAKKWTNLRWIIIGYVIGVMLSVAIVGPEADEYWKFGFAYPASFLLPMLLPQRRTWLVSLAIGALGVVHLLLGARSLGANCLLAAAAIWLPVLHGKLRYLALGVSVVVAILATNHLYQRFNDADKSMNSNTERTAMVELAGDEFMGSPLIGQGSWFAKGHRVEAFFARRAELRGETDRVDPLVTDEVSIHSQLLVSLAEGGILGGGFFIFFGGLLIWGLVFAATHDFTLRPLVLVLLLNAAWDLIMSPFSGSERVFIGLACAMLVALRALYNQQKTYA